MTAVGAQPAQGGIGAHGAEVRFVSVRKQYGPVTAVDNVSLDISPGEFLTLLGPSGSGKTTTLMMLAGFEIPTDGEIFVDDIAIAAIPPYKRNIGMVFQNYALFPHMTVGENIAFPLKMRGISKSEIQRMSKEALQLVKLPGYEGRYPRQLSGGQQQRIAVARALVFNPRVLLMDEPLGALDKQLRESLQLEIKSLHDQLGVTIVYVTHDQQEALVMSDRIAVMNEGRIEQIGSPVELYDQPQSRFVASFIGESNFLSGRVRSCENGMCQVEIDGVATLSAPEMAGAVAGEAVTVTVRPEKLLFGRSEKTHPNAVPGRIESVIFAGEMRRYDVALPNGERLILKRQNRAGEEQFAPGDEVEVAWAYEDTRLV
ncbi:MAG: ABC transporter ATP-binding protein [Thermomicrobiales bacterium]